MPLIAVSSFLHTNCMKVRIDSMSLTNQDWWSRLKDILTVLILPALFWVFSVSSNLEAQKSQIIAVKADLLDHKEKLARLEDSERQFSVQLARLETRLDAITRTTDEIRDMLTRLIDAQNRNNGAQ